MRRMTKGTIISLARRDDVFGRASEEKARYEYTNVPIPGQESRTSADVKSDSLTWFGREEIILERHKS